MSVFNMCRIGAHCNTPDCSKAPVLPPQSSPCPCSREEDGNSVMSAAASSQQREYNTVWPGWLELSDSNAAVTLRGRGSAVTSSWAMQSLASVSLMRKEEEAALCLGWEIAMAAWMGGLSRILQWPPAASLTDTALLAIRKIWMWKLLP